MTTKTWTRDMIDAIIAENDRAVERGIVQLFNLQTSDERRAECTKLNNGVGFNSCSARSGTYYAKWVLIVEDLVSVGIDEDDAYEIAFKIIRQDY